jgi:hypothetical protein
MPVYSPYRTDVHTIVKKDCLSKQNWTCVDIERNILERPENVSAFLAEPIRKQQGAVPPPPGYFEKVRELSDRYEIVLIIDEVMTGWQPGTNFATEQIGVKPDIITFGKGYQRDMLRSPNDRSYWLIVSFKTATEIHYGYIVILLLCSQSCCWTYERDMVWKTSKQAFPFKRSGPNKHSYILSGEAIGGLVKDWARYIVRSSEKAAERLNGIAVTRCGFIPVQVQLTAQGNLIISPPKCRERN